MLVFPGARATAAEDAQILYAPDVVGVDRMFMVALNVPVEAPEIEVTVPDCVTLFDRTRLPAASETRKFYFRAAKPAPKAEIRFALPGGRGGRAGRDLVLRGPAAVPHAQGRAAPAPLAAGRASAGAETEADLSRPGPRRRRAQAKASGGWLDRSDDEIWAMQPDSTIPRWHWTNIQYGCPVHGKEIYRKRAYYPWVMDSDLPVAVEDPLPGRRRGVPVERLRPRRHDQRRVCRRRHRRRLPARRARSTASSPSCASSTAGG